MTFQNCYTIFHEPLGEWNLRQVWNIISGIYAKYHVQIILLIVYTTTHKRFAIFTCRYFKLSWNTTAISQSDCRNFSCSSINGITSTTPESINERAHGLHDIGMNFIIPLFTPIQGLSSDKFHHNLQIIIRTIIRRKRNEDIGRNP